MKHTIKQCLLLASLALGAVAPAATAAQAGTPGAAARAASPRLQMICLAADLNHDGRISLDEFHHDIVRGWQALPQDGSGYVLLQDLAAIPGLPRSLARRLAQADSDHDGKLSFKEVVAARMAYFDAADTDGDDALSLQECIAHEGLRARSARAGR